MSNQNWNAKQYKDNASFVAEFGNSVLELLNPQPTEAILDLGCGDGALTEKISKITSDVIGIDSSESMIHAANGRGLDAYLMSGDSIEYKNRFDAVFTNAALHWIPDYQSVIKGVFIALKENGRFVGEFGGQGNIAILISAMKEVIENNPQMGTFKNPWYFPSSDEYKHHLENNGFEVKVIKLFSRPTPLKTGVKEWLKIFANHIISEMPIHLEDDFLNMTESIVKPKLFSDSTGWQADYVRLRFNAVKA